MGPRFCASPSTSVSRRSSHRKAAARTVSQSLPALRRYIPSRDRTSSIARTRRRSAVWPTASPGAGPLRRTRCASSSRQRSGARRYRRRFRATSPSGSTKRGPSSVMVTATGACSTIVIISLLGRPLRTWASLTQSTDFSRSRMATRSVSRSGTPRAKPDGAPDPVPSALSTPITSTPSRRK